MDPCSPLTKFSTCLNMHLLLKHRRGLPIGHGLGTGVQRRIATIEDRSFERVVVSTFCASCSEENHIPRCSRFIPEVIPSCPSREVPGLRASMAKETNAIFWSTVSPL